MKINFKHAFIIAAVFILAAAMLPATVLAVPPLKYSTAGKVNGIYVATGHNADFPSATNLSKTQLKQELDRIVDFSAQYGFNHIFFEAVTDGGALYNSKVYEDSEYLTTKKKRFLFDWNRFDPLDYLIKQAAKKNIKVTAVVNPFLISGIGEMPSNPNNIAVKNSEYVVSANGKLYLKPSEQFTQKLVASATEELAKKYDVYGILLKDFAYPTQDFEIETTNEQKTQLLTNLIGNINSKVKKARSKVTLGIMTDEAFIGKESFNGYTDKETWARNKLFDFIVPNINLKADSGAYEKELVKWKEFAQKNDIDFYTGNAANRIFTPVADNNYFDSALELNLQLFLNNQNGANGCVIRNYNSIKDNFFDVASSLSAVFSTVNIGLEQAYLKVNLDIPQEFNITRPAEKINTTYKAYYIMGTSNPSLPITMNENKIDQAPKGTFGILVNLKLGENTFYFKQGDKTQTVTISRYDPNSVMPAKISEIRQNSMFPQYDEGVQVGKEFTLFCTAPSGASVTAQANGQTVQLSQTATASVGVPAVFTAKAKLADSYPADETTRIGKITYTMNYNGKSTTYTSNGELLAVGKNSKFAIEISDMRGDTSSVNIAYEFRDKMIVSVEKGATDYVVENSGDYYKLSCGGYIHKEDVKVLEGKVNIDTTVNDISFTSDDIGETFTMSANGKPYYVSEYGENSLSVTFYNTSLDSGAAFDSSQSKLFSSVKAEYDSTKKCTTVTFTTKDKKRLWGYNVEFNQGSILIRAKNTPKLSTNPAKPLEGITIVLDAGHGGNDPGALGVAGHTGPTESQLNYLNAYASYLRLKALGANIYMTQTKDERLSYERRMDMARDLRADLYLSFHLNSTAESTDSTNAKGIEVYYNQELAVPFGNAIFNELCKATGRKERGVRKSTFRVTQMTHTPSLLCELGYMVSPEEYEQLCDPYYIYKSALGISNGIIKAVREANSSI